MGLDDEVADSHIIDMIEIRVKKFISTYSEPDLLTEENLKRWEANLCYTGYSVAFHTLYPLYRNTHIDGIIIIEITEKQDNVIKKLVRNRLIEIINECYNKNIHLGIG